jgi:hypothetical protein
VSVFAFLIAVTVAFVALAGAPLTAGGDQQVM